MDTAHSYRRAILTPCRIIRQRGKLFFIRIDNGNLLIDKNLELWSLDK